MPETTRREFIKEGGSLLIGFSLCSHLAAELLAEAADLPGSLSDHPALDSWLEVNADGSVTLLSGKIEMGQGIGTALAQIVGEELDLPVERVRVVAGDTSRTPDEGGTGGSRSVENSGSALRAAAAEARQFLLELAAERLGLPLSQLEVHEGEIRPRGRSAPSLSYGQLFGGRSFQRVATGRVVPKDPRDYRLVGQSLPRVDLPDKVAGRPAYIQDLRLPDMLHARVVRPPNYWSRLESLQEAPVKALPGVVQIVRDGSFLAVVAEREEQAIRASEVLRENARWKGEAPFDFRDDFFSYYENLPFREMPVKSRGDTAAGLEGSARVVESTFRRPYQSHGSPGPSCGLAQMKDGFLTVWTHSQNAYDLRQELTYLLGMPKQKMRVIHKDGPGCYGHNGADDAGADAALIASRVPGPPIRVQWSRRDEFQWAPFGKAAVIRLKAGIGADGRVRAWQGRIISDTRNERPGGGGEVICAWHLASPIPKAATGFSQGPARNGVPLYSFPNLDVKVHSVKGPLRVSSLRSLGAYANVFAIESFMDELAQAAGVDPVRFRLNQLDDPRAREVVQRTARAVRWGKKQKDGRGRGLAFARYKNTGAYVAVAAQVQVEESTGRVRVLRAVSAVDAGLIINPDGLRNQMEGGIIQSASWTLQEEVKFGPEGVRTRDWEDYPILRFDEVPEVEVILVNRPDQPAAGVGEVAQGPAAAAISNAICDATGVRVYTLPFTPRNVKRALAKSLQQSA